MPWSLGAAAAEKATGTHFRPTPQADACVAPHDPAWTSVSLQGLPHLLMGAECHSPTCPRGTLGACLVGMQSPTPALHPDCPLGLSAAAGQGQGLPVPKESHSSSGCCPFGREASYQKTACWPSRPFLLPLETTVSTSSCWWAGS